MNHTLSPYEDEAVSDQSSAGFQTVFIWLSVLFLIMDLLWMILTVFLACAEAENLTEVRVKLGQNVTINCSLDSSDIYWYVEIHNQLRACIVRMFGNGPDEKQYYICTTKYAAVEKRLEITNITADDCRLYFCARKKKGIIQFKDSILLVPGKSHSVLMVQTTGFTCEK